MHLLDASDAAGDRAEFIGDSGDDGEVVPAALAQGDVGHRNPLGAVAGVEERAEQARGVALPLENMQGLPHRAAFEGEKGPASVNRHDRL